MKIHLVPRVILLARPSINWDGVTEFLAEYDMTPLDWARGVGDQEGESLVELAGRACYGSFGTRQGRIGASAYLEHIIDAGHGSVLEHAQWTFAVCRASRGYTHQQVRHRAGFAYSQESQHFIHYAEEGKGTLEPAICLTGIPESAHHIAKTEALRSIEGYNKLWRVIRDSFPPGAKVKKIVSGAARGLLPTAIESRLVMSANARALRHVIALRGTPENILEVRLVAVQLLRLMKFEAPAIFADFEEATDIDNHPVVFCTHHKV